MFRKRYYLLAVKVQSGAPQQAPAMGSPAGERYWNPGWDSLETNLIPEISIFVLLGNSLLWLGPEEIDVVT